MATVTHLVTTPDTGATPNTSGAYSPTVGRLQVVFMVASGTVDAEPTMTNTEGLTFVLAASAASSSNTITTYLFVATALTSSGASQTVTGNCPNDAATGTIISVYEIDGMTKVGLDAVRQTAKQDNVSGGVAPAPTFASAVLTSNPTIGVAAGNDETPDVSAPTDWAEAAETSYTSPSTGANFVTRNDGFTGTTVTWNGTWVGGAFNSLIAEFDSSGGGSIARLAAYYRMLQAGND